MIRLDTILERREWERLINVLFQDYQGGATIKVKQTAYYCTLCKFRGASREELAQHRKRTIHNKYGGVTAVDPIAEAEERKARIRNNCL